MPAKGLEFPITFVLALVEGRFPGVDDGTGTEELRSLGSVRPGSLRGREEAESRLLYVALTRAKEILVVSWFEHHRVRRARPVAIRHTPARPQNQTGSGSTFLEDPHGSHERSAPIGGSQLPKSAFPHFIVTTVGVCR
jgi:superfamily I DNA/RNA helicase